MGLYKNNNGVLLPIAGRGKAEYGASTVRKGTYSFANASERGWRYATVTFDIPMVDTDYEIILTPSVGTTSAQAMATAYTIDNKTTNGFRISYYDTTATSNVDGNYTAFKLYTDNEYNGLLNNQRYSTDEIDTGKVWIDGKKIYRKVFTGVNITGSSSSPSWVDTSIVINDIDQIISCLGKRNKATSYFTAQYYDGSLKVHWSIDKLSGTDTLILEYTKTI